MCLKKLLLTALFILLFSAFASAADYASKAEMEMMKKEMAELKALVGELKVVITTQNETINELKEHGVEDEHVGQTAAKDHDDDGDDHGLESLFSAFKPQIEIAGDFVANLSDDHHLSSEEDRFSLRGVDIVFSGEIDGVGKAHINLAYHDDDVSLEEGYLDMYDLLPFGTDVRLGKFRANFGLLNKVHPHALPQVDYPAIYREYLGHEGYIDEGVGIAGTFPSLWNSDFDYTLQVMNGNRHSHGDEGHEEEDDHDEDGNRRLKDYNDLVYVAKLNNMIKPSDSMNIHWGLSALTGRFEDDHNSPRFYYQGADLTLKFNPFEEKYKEIRWQTEVITGQIEEGSGWERTYGLYSFIDYRFAPKWLVGGRYDYVELPMRSSDHMREYSAYLTHKYTESNQIRLQVKNTERNYDKDSNEILLQWIFLLGNKGHDH